MNKQIDLTADDCEMIIETTKILLNAGYDYLTKGEYGPMWELPLHMVRPAHSGNAERSSRYYEIVAQLFELLL